jgi:hypothetical protein
VLGVRSIADIDSVQVVGNAPLEDLEPRNGELVRGRSVGALEIGIGLIGYGLGGGSDGIEVQADGDRIIRACLITRYLCDRSASDFGAWRRRFAFSACRPDVAWRSSSSKAASSSFTLRRS